MNKRYQFLPKFLTICGIAEQKPKIAPDRTCLSTLKRYRVDRLSKGEKFLGSHTCLTAGKAALPVAGRPAIISPLSCSLKRAPLYPSHNKKERKINSI